MTSPVPKRTLGLIRELVGVVIESGSTRTLYSDVPSGPTQLASCDTEEVDPLQDKELRPRSAKVTESIQQLFNLMS